MKDTKIEWCDHTFNCWRGCTKVSPGCAHCYAETMSKRNPGVLGMWGPQGTRVVASEAMWREPVKWDREAKAEGVRKRVFCASLADVFEDWRGPLVGSNGERLFHDSATPPWCEFGAGREVRLDHVRRRLWNLIEATPNLDWLLLTKRPENVLRMTYDAWCKPVPGHVSQNVGDGRHWYWPSNVWLGTSVEDQQCADERIPHLLKTPAAVRFLSVEPLLSKVTLWPWLCDPKQYRTYVDDDGKAHVAGGAEFKPGTSPISWVIIGGESGHGARRCQLEWVRSLVRQCKTAGVACFVKQLGSRPVADPDHGGPMTLHLRDSKGGDIEEFPADLRIRQFPGDVR